jgi:uncharacterized Zn-binding protein involved in type VI secretion
MLPAARVTDNHLCALVSGVVPHVGGPILPPGMPKTQIVGLAAARVSDMATCAGGPDVIAMGAATVLIGGLPAARVTDSTAHGGLILPPGAPTVLIGGPVFKARAVTWSGSTMMYGSGIKIPYDPANPNFQSDALAALVRLETSPNFRAALDSIEASGNQVTIIPYVPPAGWGPYNAYCDPAWTLFNDHQRPGVGSDSTVAWDPTVNGFGPPGTTPNSSQPGADILLAHEMIHAAHNANGTQPSGPINNNSINVNEERNTVGLPAGTYNRPGDPLNGTPLGDTTGLPYTENGVRQDYADNGIDSPVTGAPPVQRPSYYNPTPTGGAGAPF